MKKFVFFSLLAASLAGLLPEAKGGVLVIRHRHRHRHPHVLVVSAAPSSVWIPGHYAGHFWNRHWVPGHWEPR